MEQKHWAGVALCLLALLVVSVGGDPDGSGWIAGIGVGVLVGQIVLIWHMWEIWQAIDAAVVGQGFTGMGIFPGYAHRNLPAGWRPFDPDNAATFWYQPVMRSVGKNAEDRNTTMKTRGNEFCTAS